MAILPHVGRSARVSFRSSALGRILSIGDGRFLRSNDNDWGGSYLALLIQVVHDGLLVLDLVLGW